MSIPATISKCVILARGLGTRMRSGEADTPLDTEQSSVASSGLKAMIPVGRPFLDYVLSALADAGFRQACLVIGPEHNVVREHYTRAYPTRIEVSFALQAEALGTANAVLAAEQFAGAEEFATINSDNYYPVEVLRALQELGQAGTVLFDADALVRESNIPAERVRDFAYAVIDAKGFLTDLIEKPDAETATELAGGAKLVSMNCWRFGPEMFSFCHEVPLSPRGEYELPLAVGLAIQHGWKFKCATSRAGVLDLSRRSDIAAVAERLREVKVEL